MESLHRIRQAYDENYRQMLEIIQQMGGDEQIRFHRQRRSALYKKLKYLQRREHYLDEVESRLQESRSLIH